MSSVSSELARMAANQRRSRTGRTACHRTGPASVGRPFIKLTIYPIKRTTLNHQAHEVMAVPLTLAECPSRGEYSCCHRAHCLSEASLREWQQTGAAAEQGAQRVTTSSLPPLAVPSPTEAPQPPSPPSHPAQRRWPKTSRVASQSLTTKQPTRQPP